MIIVFLFIINMPLFLYGDYLIVGQCFIFRVSLNLDCSATYAYFCFLNNSINLLLSYIVV